MSTVTLYAATLESLELPIKTDVDPTGSTVQFALSDSGADSPGSFTDGAWAGSYNTATGITIARTALIGGSGGSHTIVSGESYAVWVKIVSLGSESPAWKVGQIGCP